MTGKQFIASIIISIIVGFFLTSPVFADGQYGQYGAGSETPSEQPKEEVHHTVDADLGDNLFALALGFVGLAGVFTFLSKKSANFEWVK